VYIYIDATRMFIRLWIFIKILCVASERTRRENASKGWRTSHSLCSLIKNRANRATLRRLLPIHGEIAHRSRLLLEMTMASSE
jgi:hypothetical protein